MNKETLVTIVENVEDETIGEENESTLDILIPRKKKQKTKAGSLSSLSPVG